MRTDIDHRLNGEAHAGLCSPYCLVFAVVRDVGGAVEQLIDTMTAVGLDHTAVPALGVLFNHISWFTEKHAGFYVFNTLFQALPSSLNNPDGIRACLCLLPNVVCFVDISVETFMIQSHVDVDDVTILERPLVWDTVANRFVDGRADRFGKVDVVKRRWVRLNNVSFQSSKSAR